MQRHWTNGVVEHGFERTDIGDFAVHDVETAGTVHPCVHRQDCERANCAGHGDGYEHRGVYAPGIGFVIFGGISGQGMSVAERGRAKLNDLWAFDGTRWNRLDP